MPTPALGSYTQLVSKFHSEEIWRSGKKLLQHCGPRVIAALRITHVNSSVSPPHGIAPPCNTTQTEEFKPLLASLELVLYLPLDLKGQLTATNIYTQNTEDTVHIRKNAAETGEVKSPFHEGLLRLPLQVA